MPVERIYKSEEAIWGYWRILEDEQSLESEVPHERPADALRNPLKRREFLAVRLLTKTLLSHWGAPFHGLMKDPFGKPFLRDSSFQISLSHSYPYVAAIIHRHKNVGIDLEQPKAKLLHIAPRILAAEELSDAGDNITKHCVYWCAKETLIKIYGRKDLVLAKNLLIKPFAIASQGHIIGRIVANNTETAIPLEYIVSENFVVVVSD